MSSCIICGSSADGRVCELHEEDVVFEFRGDHPNQLTPNRYYRGTVDGYAEFGIFVDIGDSITGLLHKSELDQRLDSIDLEPGDEVFVQVQNVRDNGNIDLGWSIRQSRSDFRGALVDDPDGEETVISDDTSGEEPVTHTPSESTAQTQTEPTDEASDSASDEESAETAESTEAPAESQASEADEEATAESQAAESATVDRLEDLVGDRVRLEGEVVNARQTSGPTIFELRDETGTVECAAFEEAGVRAYPEVDEGDIVRIEGHVERRRGELQVETEALVILEDEERTEVTERMEEALLERARPQTLEPLAADEAVESTLDEIRDTAAAIRRAVIEGRPVVVRHADTADGYVGATAIERATLPLIREHHQQADAEYHYFDRRPLEGSVYDMNDATKDVTSMLSNQDRHGENLPLFVFVAAGGTEESLDGFDLLDVYDVRRAVVDEREIDSGVAAAVDVLVNPVSETTATALAANVAAHVNPDRQGDIGHLPAVSFWENAPDNYLELAAEAGYDDLDVARLREAVTLEAHYQSYEDKRELIIDLLFAEEAEDPMRLATHISEQFRKRMDTAIETAMANLTERELNGETVLVLDTDAYTHRYEFPPKPLLLDELYRRNRDSATALLGVDRDEAYIRTDADIDVRELIERASTHAPGAGLDARGAREGRVEFLSGERDPAQEALLQALADELSAAAV
ncbi:OB-fold nucleic acid binding domain-containing protein [Halovenus marina]|uniref:DHH family phosphoesterase n=1 Tax=Halovenus marina TaxID=3396621 RepID=UPI003F57DA43